MNSGISLVSVEQISDAIFLIRGRRVMLDRSLAALYGVTTGNLNKAIKRNPDRFPADFMFPLTTEEAQACLGSRFQIGSLKRGQNLKYLPHAFTEQGVAMLSSVLHSPRAARVNVEIMRAFVRLREVLALHKDLARRLAELEGKQDQDSRAVWEAIRRLMTPPAPPSRRIGFVQESQGRYRASSVSR